MKSPQAVASPAPAPPLARRDLRSFTASTEKKVLIALAKRMPSWVGPDHLTALGVLAMAGAGVCYRFAAVTPMALLGVNICLFLNWFGDSLDGTLARVRDQQRPRYGFYVDHLVDAFGAIFLLSGLAASGLVSVLPALAVLTAYLLLQIHIALKAHATSVFQIAFGGIGGTEARILMAALNLGLMIEPALIPVVEPFLWLVAAGLLSLVVWDGVATGRALDLSESGGRKVLSPPSPALRPK